MRLLGLILFVPAFLYSALVAVSPRGMWWLREARWHRNPEALEPSDDAYTVQRVMAVIMMVVMLALFVWAL